MRFHIHKNDYFHLHRTKFSLTVCYFERSAPRLALTNGELKPSAPFGGLFLLTVSSAPGANLWRVETLSAL